MNPFYAALHNTVRIAPYDKPICTGRPAFEFIIVNRPRSEILTISNAGPAPETAPTEAPVEIRETDTIVGTLICSDTESGKEVFIFNRFLPSNVAIRGRFFPADGTAELTFESERPYLRAAGRHSHVEILRRGYLDYADADGDGSKNAKAFAWHFKATPLAWSEEIF